MKRHYWSLLKACWLKSGRRRRMLMVHQWMHPDKVNMRYDALYVQKWKEKEELHPPIWFHLPASSQWNTHKSNLYKLIHPRHDFRAWKKTWRSHEMSLQLLCSLILPSCPQVRIKANLVCWAINCTTLCLRTFSGLYGKEWLSSFFDTTKSRWKCNEIRSYRKNLVRVNNKIGNKDY